MKVAQSCPTICDPMDYIIHGILQDRILEWVAFPFSRGSSQPRSPTLQADSLPAEPQGKPKNTGVGSWSLLLRIFLTQQSNQGPLHCRRILYQMRYQGSYLHECSVNKSCHYSYSLYAKLLLQSINTPTTFTKPFGFLPQFTLFSFCSIKYSINYLLHESVSVILLFKAQVKCSFFQGALPTCI